MSPIERSRSPRNLGKNMDRSRLAGRQKTMRLVLATLVVFAVLCFAFAGVTILETGTPTARLIQHPVPPAPG